MPSYPVPIIIRRNIPIFRPHIRKNKDGQEIYEVTASDLREIAENTNRLAVQSGVYPRITLGHINPELPETQQPPIVGWAKNCQTGKFKDIPVDIIDFCIDPAWYEEVKKYPYRSVEYRPDTKEIRGIALLKRDPALDLGIAQYIQSPHKIFYYSLGADLMDPNDDDYHGDNSMVDDPAASPDDDASDMTPEDQAKADKMYKYMCKKYSWMANCSKKYSEAPVVTEPGQPGGSNTAPMGSEPPKDKPKGYAGDPRMTQHYQAMQAQLDAIKQERDEEKIKRMLDTLHQVECYEFDYSKELKRMLKMSEAERTERMQEIRKHHHQLPSAPPIQIYQGSVSMQPETTPEQADKAVSLVTKGKFATYEEALAFVKKQG